MKHPLPAEPGIYVLCIHLDESRCLAIGALGDVAFPAGSYLYIGSAHGPGGLKARIGRHLRQDGKRVHWHIDVLLQAARVESVCWTIDPAMGECVLAQRLARSGLRFPVGFGASDCHCGGHLIQVNGEKAISNLRAMEGMRCFVMECCQDISRGVD